MKYGRLAKDLAFYHLQSEQIPTAINLGVSFNQDGEVSGAGGLMLQAMPGADEGLLEQLEETIHTVDSMGQVVHTTNFPESWIEKTFKAHQPKLLDQRGVEFMCHCNQDRIKALIAMLKEEEISEMAENGPFPVEIRCHYCNTVFGLSQNELLQIRNLRRSKN